MQDPSDIRPMSEQTTTHTQNVALQVGTKPMSEQTERPFQPIDVPPRRPSGRRSAGTRYTSTQPASRSLTGLLGRCSSAHHAWMPTPLHQTAHGIISIHNV